jgi:DNA modification methylase
MQIKNVAVAEINPAPYNPRVDLKAGDPEYEKLKSSMESFGYIEPLVWNERTKTLVSGHQRLKILKEQGIQEVEVSVVDLPVDKEKLLNLALNKIRGEWDEDKLAELLQELQAVPDINIGLTGFEIPEISEILDSHAELTKDDDFDFQAAVDAIGEPVTKRGDILQLGEHRILCGDSSKPEDLQLLLGGEKVQLLHTDPPYNVDYYGGNRPHGNGRPKQSRQWERIYSDNMTQEEYEKWLRQVFSNMSGFLAEGAAVYVWNGHRQFGPMHLMLHELGFHVAAVITWVKPNFAIGYGDYNQQTEFCLYGWRKDNGAHRWYGPNNESTLWEINRDRTTNYQHPTQKPVAIPARAIKNSSVRNDIVLDLFLGSGSTLIGAENLGRRCYGIEIDPKYCDAIVRRYIAFAGQDKVSDDVRAKYMEGSHGK